MRIGPLRHRLTMQEQSVTRASNGEELIAWVTADTVWGNVRPASGREAFVSAGDQQLAVITHRVEIRWRADLTPKMRFLWDGRILEIEQVGDPSGKRASLVVQCRENYVGG